MAQRLAISDAPLATLGELGAEQNIPLANKVGTADAIPQRTTVESLAEYIGTGGEGFQPQIQTFVLPTGTGQRYSVPSNFAINSRTGSGRIQWTNTGKIVWAGDDDYYFAQNGDLFLTQDGVYSCTFTINAIYSNQSGTGNWRLRLIADIITPTEVESIEGVQITPALSPNARSPTLINAGITFRNEGDSRVRINLSMQNVGFGATGNPHNEFFELISGDDFRRCMATIRKLS